MRGESRRIILTVVNQGTVNEIPVNEESTLQGMNLRARHLNHCVAPGLRLCSLDITQGDIHTTDKAYPAVDDHQLTVVAVVHLTGERGKTHGQKRHHLDTFLTHPLEEAVRHAPTAYVIVDDTHLYPLAYLVYQSVSHEITQRVVLEDIHIDMNMVCGRGYRM